MNDNERFCKILDQLSILAAEARGSFSLRYMLVGGWTAMLSLGDEITVGSGNTRLSAILKLIERLPSSGSGERG